MNKKEQYISNIAKYFTIVNNKLNKLGKKAIVFEEGEKLYASEIHTIQAIGKKHGNTVTELCDLFGVTKGAVSQIIGKLEKRGYIVKLRNADYAKEINIYLTEKGWRAFNYHEELHNKMDREFIIFMEAMTEDQLNDFLEVLKNIEKYVDKFSN